MLQRQKMADLYYQISAAAILRSIVNHNLTEQSLPRIWICWKKDSGRIGEDSQDWLCKLFDQEPRQAVRGSQKHKKTVLVKP